MKTLYIVSGRESRPSEKEVEQLEKQDEYPRVTLLDNALNAELMDDRFVLEKSPLIRRIFYKWLPITVAKIIEVLFIHQQYDVILTQTEREGFPLAVLMNILRIKKPNVMIISRITSKDRRKTLQKKWLLKRGKDAVSHYLIWSSVQRNLAIKELDIPPEKISLIKRGTDQQFWRPIHSKTDTICSVGMEMRDYPTLVEALRPLDIPCHIAAGTARGELYETVKKLYSIDELPPNITVEPKNYRELRALYARSRFVVVSLLPTDSDNGLTAILEAMAMGKAVICSRVEGQVDVIEDNKTGIFVQQGDPQAMRKAIYELWNDPERAEEMGRLARKYIERHHNIEQFSEAIKQRVFAAAKSESANADFQKVQVEM